MIISWNTTRACNLACKHCYRDAGRPDPDELTLPQAKKLLDEIKRAGFRIVILSGGEPLLRDDIYRIIAYANSIGLRPVLGSNGTLITREVAHKLKQAGLARAGISLDSTDEKIHDEFRGLKGSFNRLMGAMKALKEAGLEFQVHTTVTKYNYGQIEKLMDFVIASGASAYHIFFLVPSGRGSRERKNIISQKEYYTLLSKILEKQKETPVELKPVCAPHFIPIAAKKQIDVRFKRGCLAGISYCCILPNGDVHPCPYLPLNVGNVTKTPFDVLWKHNKVFSELRTLAYKGSCAACHHKATCGGCRARAWAQFRDYMQQDSYCLMQL